MSQTDGSSMKRRRSERLVAVAAAKARCLADPRDPTVASVLKQEESIPQRRTVSQGGPAPDKLQRTTGLLVPQQSPASEAVDITPMPPAPSDDDWMAVEDWVDEYERKMCVNSNEAWRAWRRSETAGPLVIPGLKLSEPFAFEFGQEAVADYVVDYIGDWINANRLHVSQLAVQLNDGRKYIFDDVQLATINSVFAEAGVPAATSVVLDLLDHVEIEGDLFVTFECSRELMYSVAPTLSLTRNL